MLTLEEVKRHCRIDHNDEDALIEALMTTATAACADYLNMDAADLVVAVPAPVKAAALISLAACKISLVPRATSTACSSLGRVATSAAALIETLLSRKAVTSSGAAVS